MEKNDNFLTTMDTIGNALQAAETYELIDEVVTSMFIFARENPKWTVDEVMGASLKEWDIYYV